MEQFQQKATHQPTAKDLYDVDEKRRGAFVVGSTRNKTMVQVTTTTTVDTLHTTVVPTAVTAAVAPAVTIAITNCYCYCCCYYLPPTTTNHHPTTNHQSHTRCVQSIEPDETEHGNTIENTGKHVSGRAPGYVGPAPNRCASIEKGKRQHSGGTRRKKKKRIVGPTSPATSSTKTSIDRATQSKDGGRPRDLRSTATTVAGRVEPVAALHGLGCPARHRQSARFVQKPHHGGKNPLQGFPVDQNVYKVARSGGENERRLVR